MQDADNRQVFIALTAYLVHIDALRNFALLNTLALLKIANYHCSKTLCDDILARLYQEPFYNCYRLTSLVDEIRSMQKLLLKKIFGDAAPQSPQASMNDMTAEAENHREAPMHDDDAASRVSPSSSDSDLRQTGSHTDAKDLAAYCTWVNQKGRLPAWVCQGCEDPSKLNALKGDLRSISVAPLVAAFARKLRSVLAYLDLGHLLPHLIHSIQQQRRRETIQQQQRQMLVQQQLMREQQQQNMHMQFGNACAAEVRFQATPAGPKAHSPDSPATNPLVNQLWQQQMIHQQHLQHLDDLLQLNIYASNHHNQM